MLAFPESFSSIFMCCPGDAEIWVMISNKLDGNQQLSTKLGGAIVMISRFPGVFWYLQRISFASLLGLGKGIPGGGNMGSGIIGFCTCVKGGLSVCQLFYTV